MVRLAILVNALLSGCATPTAEFEQRLLDTLPDKRGVVFEDTATYAGKALCGHYTATTLPGNRKVTCSFVVTPDQVLEDAFAMETAVYCSNDAQSALFTAAGLGGDEQAWTALERIAVDMHHIEAGVIACYNARYQPPRELAGLLEGDFGVEAGQLTDPWARPYLYDPGMAGRSVPRIRLRSLGADGLPGGRGINADVSLEQLSTLRHVLALREA